MIASSSLVVAGACASSGPAADVAVGSPPASTTVGVTSTAPVSSIPNSIAAGPSTGSTVTSSTASLPIGDVTPFPTRRPWRVLVVGDSVAASLAGERPQERLVLSGSVQVEVLNVGSVACPVIFDGAWWFSNGSTLPDNPVCDRPERYDDALASFEPDVVLAVFGWPGAGGGQRFSDGTIAAPCEARFDGAWEEGYRDLIARLAPHAVVVAATVAPIAMDARRPETRCLNDIVRRLPAPVFDLQDWLCPELDCSSRAVLRTDGVHFAAEAALRRAALTGIMTEVLGIVGPAASRP